jgi:hypothetical protein
MSVVDFLFEGKAPAPVTLTGTSAVQLPEWYTQYTTDMLGRAQAVANLPYAAYPGPRIAPFTPTEQTGFEATKAAAGAYQPFLQQAGSTLGQAGAISGLGAAEPLFTQAAGMMGAPAAAPFLTQAGGMSAAAAAQPFLAQGISPISRAGEASAVSAAQPFLSRAGRAFPQAVQEYMSPYIQNVVEQIGDIGVRQLQEKYLPEIGQEFIQAGQFGPGPGSSRMGEFGARALRDVQQSILAEQAKALQAGYGQAADIFGRDVDRLTQLAGTVGQLSTADYNRMLESGARIADVGAKIGQLTAEDAQRLTEIGKATGALTQQDAANLARIAESRGQLSQQDAANLQSLASKYLGMGEAAQSMGITGAEAITGVGAKERAMQQANLDLAYQDFLRQEGYPEERIKFLSNVLSGVQIPKTEITTQQTIPKESELTTGLSEAANTYKVLDEILKGSTGKDIGDLLRRLFGG